MLTREAIAGGSKRAKKGQKTRKRGQKKRIKILAVPLERTHAQKTRPILLYISAHIARKYVQLCALCAHICTQYT